LLIAVVLSVAVHVVAALLIVLLPRVLPREARPQEQGTVELLMVEKKGAEPSAAGPKQDSPPEPPHLPKQEAAAKPRTPKPEPQAAPPPAPPPLPSAPAADVAGEPAPAPVVARQEAKAEARAEAPTPSPPPSPTPPPPPSPPAPKAAEAPVFDLAGTESESNAEVLGGHILPASPDNRFRNKPPIYPDDAAIRGEHGSVLLVIHVSVAGIASGVDVVQSSGVASLDQAALTAVRKWRFHPALREGEAVPFDMPFRFVFEAN
jgi:protein TonB